jgi:peptidoglycan hydrolase-like protein with peptidoglycan-binding domain
MRKPALIAAILVMGGCVAPAVQPAAPVSMPIQETPIIISEVQGLLNARGYNVGRPDGVAGARTRAAVQKFERDNGLPADGIIDAAVYAALKRTTEKPLIAATDTNVPSGEGMLGVRIENGNSAGVTLYRIFFSNDTNNLRIADEHCAKYGKAAQFVSRENDRRRYNCVQP